MTAGMLLMPFVGMIGGGFFVGLLTGYAIKKIIKITAVIVAFYRCISVYAISTNN